jgi:superfamily II DNA/RNA helicase
VTTEARWLSLERLKYTVLDEADEMIQEDWEEAMKHLLGGGASSMEGDHQFLLFSATFPARARSLAKKYLADDNIRISVGRVGSTHMNIRQDVSCLVMLLIWSELTIFVDHLGRIRHEEQGSLRPST